MEAKFELSEQDHRYLFENANDAMWVHDMEGNILDGNRAFEKLTGYSLKEWAGMNIRQFLTEEFKDVAKEVRRRLLNGEAIEQPYEQRLLRKDGTTRIVKMATSPLIINGEVRGFQHVARDVTKEKQLEENMRYYVQLITKAQEEERKRLARELHDEVAPPLLLLTQRLDTITSSTQPKLPVPVKEKLEDLRNRTVEALSNIRRHAEASLAVVKLEFGDNKVTMTVSDNGKGFELPARVEDLASTDKLGIIGMYEWARLLGGTLRLNSELDKGTEVVAASPL